MRLGNHVLKNYCNHRHNDGAGYQSNASKWNLETGERIYLVPEEDLDAAQSVPGLPGKYQKKAAHKLAIARDTFVAGLMKSGAALAQNTVADDGTISEYKISKTTEIL